jgi:hypothetical protein
MEHGLVLGLTLYLAPLHLLVVAVVGVTGTTLQMVKTVVRAVVVVVELER